MTSAVELLHTAAIVFGGLFLGSVTHEASHYAAAILVRAQNVRLETILPRPVIAYNLPPNSLIRPLLVSVAPLISGVSVGVAVYLTAWPEVLSWGRTTVLSTSVGDMGLLAAVAWSWHIGAGMMGIPRDFIPEYVRTGRVSSWDDRPPMHRNAIIGMGFVAGSAIIYGVFLAINDPNPGMFSSRFSSNVARYVYYTAFASGLFGLTHLALAIAEYGFEQASQERGDREPNEPAD